jgi:hypothetical protein
MLCVYTSLQKVDSLFLMYVLFCEALNFFSIVPVFLVSNVTGKNINLLTTFLNLLPPQVRHNDSLALPPCEFMVRLYFSWFACISRGRGLQFGISFLFC